jgi:hypothetical protein
MFGISTVPSELDPVVRCMSKSREVGELQQNAFLSLDFLQIETGTSLRGELNESAKKKGGHRRFDGIVAGEASTTLPGLRCECAKSRAARQNRRG